MKELSLNILDITENSTKAQAEFVTIKIMEDGNADNVKRDQYHHYEKPYIFLRDVDVEPIVLDSEDIFDTIRSEI